MFLNNKTKAVLGKKHCPLSIHKKERKRKGKNEDKDILPNQSQGRPQKSSPLAICLT